MSARAAAAAAGARLARRSKHVSRAQTIGLRPVPFLLSVREKLRFFSLEERGMVRQWGKKGWRVVRFGKDLGVIFADDQQCF